MIRSTRVQKAERLRAAQRLLADEIGMAEAAMALSRAFGLSRRQAYRYLELARAGTPAPVAENSVAITLKYSASGTWSLESGPAMGLFREAAGHAIGSPPTLAVHPG